MTFEKFNELLQFITGRINKVLGQKSADYSDGEDKLFNFKHAGRMKGVTPIEALRGMHLKHQSSLEQGLDELKVSGTLRDWDWWLEKSIDDINYSILRLALIKELIDDQTRTEYYRKVCDEHEITTFSRPESGLLPEATLVSGSPIRDSGRNSTVGTKN